jgi:hypothetical protein
MNWQELVSKGPIVTLLVLAQPDLLIPGDWNAAAAKTAKFLLAIGGAYLGSLLRPRTNKKRALVFFVIMLLALAMLLLYQHLLNTPPRVEQVRLFNCSLVIGFGLFFLCEGFCVGELVAFLFAKVGAWKKK